MDVAFLIEPALKAGVAPVAARNFNPLMAMAVATLIAETNEVVPLGCCRRTPSTRWAYRSIT